MANDPPTSMQLRFGGREAQEIGVTGFHEPRAASSINLNVNEQEALRRIASLSKQHPDLKERFAEMARKNFGQKRSHQRTLWAMYEIIRDKCRIERWRKMHPPQSGELAG